MNTQHTHSETSTQSTAPDAWRDAWSEDREATRVAARIAESERYSNVDDRYSRDDYMSALRRAMSAQ